MWYNYGEINVAVIHTTAELENVINNENLI